MISIVTPTHDPKYLPEAAVAVMAQTYQGEWEWVIVPNGAARGGCREFAGLPHCRVVDYPEDAPLTIGGIKRFACEQVQGQIIVELDHDDILAPNALERVAAEFAAHPDCGMVYSNFAEFQDGTWEPSCYNELYGWRYRPQQIGGHCVMEAQTFAPTAQSLASINFAPNHIRAWLAQAYWDVGGHDASMLVADDHDLCCRFYLSSWRIRHIDECLYLYRLHPANSYKQLLTDVHAAARAVRDRYLYRLVPQWAALEGLQAVDICCGAQAAAGYTGVDARHGPVRADLNERWPFEDSSVGVIRAMDALEHLRDPIHTMEEAWRVLAPGGWLISMTPSTDGRGAFQDPTHCSWWNENSFHYWTQARYQQFLPPVDARFQAVRLVTWFPSQWHEAQHISYVTADLVCVKDAYRGPGLLEI